ncbi:hypothetical protein AK830_g4738 [Neonectria ditissima]|uniref:Xylanolytic transcriptional activator regulatory domain-containing protein n=1 Tax=Neonectria ditissima TaxID=78410 RepID=A0A0N8H7I0_9HYPO|nr:hypothetical protein AK830_g4738 [Neonectria ditissima]
MSTLRRRILKKRFEKEARQKVSQKVNFTKVAAGNHQPSQLHHRRCEKNAPECLVIWQYLTASCTRHQNRRKILFSPHDISWLFKLPQYIAAYFDRFHPTLPALHWPSIDMATTREPLLQAIACIGAVYHSPGHKFSLVLFEAGLKSLDQYTREDRSRFREVWVIQAYLLFEYFATYSCQEDLFPRALGVHRTLVDAAREFQMLQDGAALNSGSSDTSMDRNDGLDSEETRWKTFIESESQKRPDHLLALLSGFSNIHQLQYQTTPLCT